MRAQADLLGHFLNAWPGTTALDRDVVDLLGLGWAGVDLFFVLSGFLITGILVDQVGAPGWWTGFLLRRALRIFPLYYLALALFGLLGPALGFIDPWTFGRWGFWYWTYLGNWAYAARQVIPPLSHFWSLGVEEQFYLLWPLVVLAARRRRLAALTAGLVVISPALRAWIVQGSGWPVGSAFRVTLGRLDGLAMGALLAVAFRDRSHVTVDLLMQYLRPRPRQIVELVAQASVLVFLVLFIWSGVRLTVNNIQQYGMQLRISMAYVYVLLPLGGAISLVVVLTYFWLDVLRLLGRDAA